MNKKNIMALFAVSLISMQVVASDKNAELAARAEKISSHILEALVNEAIVEAQAVVNKSVVKKGHVASASIVRTSNSPKNLRDVDNAEAYNQQILPQLEKVVIFGGLMGNSSTHRDSASNSDQCYEGWYLEGGFITETGIPGIGKTYLPSKPAIRDDKPQLVRFHADALHPAIIAPMQQSDKNK